MGHHEREYGFGQSRHGASVYRDTLGRMPRGLKIGLVIAALVLLLAGLALVGLVAVILVKLVSGGALPGFLQYALDLVKRNLQPLLGFWNTLQGLTGK